MAWHARNTRPTLGASNSNGRWTGPKPKGLIASHEINNVVYVLLCSRQAGDPDE